MSEFHDPELRQQLGRLSGPYPDDNAAFTVWQRRVRQARRRRAVAWTTGAAMSLVMGTVAVSALQNPGRNTIVPGGSSESSDLTVGIATTEADDSSTTESTAPKTTPATTLAPDTSPSTEAADHTSMPETDATEASGSGHEGSPSNGPGDGSPTTPAPQTSEQPQTATKTVPSIGGTITVHQAGDQLTVIGIHPAAGFQASETEPSGHQVRVIFTSGDHESRISVRLSNGIITPEVSENAEGHETSVPGDNSGDSSGGGHGGGGNG